MKDDIINSVILRQQLTRLSKHTFRNIYGCTYIISPVEQTTTKCLAITFVS